MQGSGISFIIGSPEIRIGYLSKRCFIQTATLGLDAGVLGNKLN